MKIAIPKKGTGIYIPDITVEMFRNAHLEFVEELLAEGEMVDIDIEEMKLLSYQRGLLQMKEAIDETLGEMPEFKTIERRGVWVKEINDEGRLEGWHCSNCYDTTGFHTIQTTEFCPKCGARMESEEE